MKKQVKFLVALAALLVVGLVATNMPVHANDSDYVRVEFLPPANWDGVGAWGWGDNGEVMQGASWPGSALDWDATAEAYVFAVPTDLAPFTMFFMDTADAYDRTAEIWVEGDMRIDLSGIVVSILPPTSWEGVAFWGWGSENCDVTYGRTWDQNPPLEWNAALGAYAVNIGEDCAPFTMFFMDTANPYSRTDEFEVHESVHLDQSGLRLGFTHPNWSQVYVVAWDNNGSLEGFEDGAAMSFDDESGEWYISIAVEEVEMPFTVYFHNGAGERTADRPVTRPDTIPYERVRYVAATDDAADDTDVEDVDTDDVDDVIVLDVQDDEDDNTMLFIIIGAVVVVAVVVVVATKKKK